MPLKIHLTAFVFDGILYLVVVLRCLRGAWPVEFHAWTPLFLYRYIKRRDMYGKNIFYLRTATK